MAADFQKPAIADAYASVLQSVRDLASDLAKGLDNTGTQNIPVNAIRWSSAANRWEKYNGSAWAALATQYAIDVATVGGKSVGNANGNVPLSNGTVNANLNAEMVGGLKASNLGATKSLRDFSLGTLITTSIDYSVTYGDAWVFEISGNSYGNGTPFNIQLQGYIYNGAIIQYSGMKLGAAPNQFIILNSGGYLCLWMPRLGYWNGFTVTAYVATVSGTKTNVVTSITDSAQPAGATKIVDITSAVSTAWHSGNFNPASIGAGAGNIGAAGTYGGFTAVGAANGWAGFRFNSSNRYWMSDGASTGEYADGVGWQWRFSNGTLDSGTVPWARLSGVPAMNYYPSSGGQLNGAMQVTGDVHVGYQQNSSRLYMGDADESTGGPKAIHANSNVIGYLNGSGSWLTYTTNAGQVYTAGYGWLHDYFATASSSAAKIGNCGSTAATLISGFSVSLVKSGTNLSVSVSSTNCANCTDCSC